MDINSLNNYFLQYGFMFLFLIVLLEYMNLPGFPSGIIMPLAGFWIYKSNLNFTLGFIISVLAGLIGSWILYFLGRFGGNVLLEKYIKKFPKQKKIIDRNLDLIRERGNIAIFISKLLPVLRTIVPIPAGVIKMDFFKYTIYSTLGIAIWNFAFMIVGYMLAKIS